MSFHLKRTKKILNWPHGHIVGAKWCNIRCEARVVNAVVAKAPAGWWCEGMAGTTRRAVEIRVASKTFYVDFEDGVVIKKLTVGQGNPSQEFCILPVKYVSLEHQQTIDRIYKAAA